MALVACPKCTSSLRVPDGSTAAVRCPKCQTVFSPPKPAKPAFEVVEDAAASPPPPRPAPKPPAKPAVPAAAEPDFEVVDDDRPRSRRRDRDDDEDDDDDRPRRRRRERDEDDEDDCPRGRGRRGRDDDDDDDDRPRRGRRTRSRDDYDDDDRPAAKRSALGLGRVGLLLILISLGLYFGGIALHLLFLLIAWIGASIPNALLLITGLLGLANWVVALVGLGLAIAGPARSRGLAIAATSVATVHLVLAFVVANDKKSAAYGNFTIEGLSISNRFERLESLRKELSKEMEKNPGGARAKELLEDLRARGGGDDDDNLPDYDRSGMRWPDMVTFLPYLDKLIAVLCYQSKGFENYLLGLFAGMFELARFILIALLVGSLARAAKAHDAAGKAKIGWVSGSIAAGVCLLVVLLVAFIIETSAESARKSLVAGQSAPPQFRPDPKADFQQQHRDHMKQIEEWQNRQKAEFEAMQAKLKSAERSRRTWMVLGELLVFAAHGGALVLPFLAALNAFSVAGRRSR